MHFSQALRWTKRRVSMQWRLKLAMLLGLPVCFLVGYFGAMRIALFKPLELPLSRWDMLIPEHPWGAHAYHSLWLMNPVMPGLAPSRRALLQYLRGLLLLSCSAFVVFLTFPMAGPRAQILPIAGWESYLSGIDLRLNAMPSLHAGLATYSALYGVTIARRWPRAASRSYLLIAAAWTLLILWSTLATRQHFLIDLPAGMALAFVSFKLSQSHRRSNHAKSITVQADPLKTRLSRSRDSDRRHIACR
jgi:membrane-associated phospholipid phosphatase